MFYLFITESIISETNHGIEKLYLINIILQNLCGL